MSSPRPFKTVKIKVCFGDAVFFFFLFILGMKKQKQWKKHVPRQDYKVACFAYTHLLKINEKGFRISYKFFR